MVQTMLKLVTSHEPIFRVASKTESMGHISVPPLYIERLCTRFVFIAGGGGGGKELVSICPHRTHNRIRMSL